MSKMNVIAFRSTSHVLGVATRSTQPDKAVTVDEVAPNGIAVRAEDDTELRALIDKSQLKVALVDYDTRVVYRPHWFVVTEDLNVEQQDEVNVVTVTNMDGTTIDIKLPAITPSDIEVLVHVSGGTLAEPAIVTVPILKTTDTGDAGLALGSGDYTVVIFAPGYVTTLVAQSVP
jgi:hypothetical protein